MVAAEASVLTFIVRRATTREAPFVRDQDTSAAGAIAIRTNVGDEDSDTATKCPLCVIVPEPGATPKNSPPHSLNASSTNMRGARRAESRKDTSWCISRYLLEYQKITRDASAVQYRELAASDA